MISYFRKALTNNLQRQRLALPIALNVGSCAAIFAGLHSGHVSESQVGVASKYDTVFEAVLK